MSMGFQAEGLACADPVAMTPIGVSGNYFMFMLLYYITISMNYYGNTLMTVLNFPVGPITCSVCISMLNRWGKCGKCVKLVNRNISLDNGEQWWLLSLLPCACLHLFLSQGLAPTHCYTRYMSIGSVIQ